MSIWRPIPEWEDYYEVSSDGRVRRFDYWQPGGNGARRLIPAGPVPTWTDPGGYTNVALKRKGRRLVMGIHVLVLQTFVELKPTPDSVARHLDGNPANNTPENLAWGTAAENTEDMIRHGRHVNLRKTHCPYGHAYDEGNTIIRCGGRRACRTCKNARDRRRYWRTKTDRAALTTP